MKIKLRGWSEKLMVMIYASNDCCFILDDKDCVVMISQSGKHTSNEKVIPMLCTGMKDRNGILIYEGDFIRIDYSYTPWDPYDNGYDDSGYYTGEVCYRPSSGFGLKNVMKFSDSADHSNGEKHNYLNRIVQSRALVIGNIYES